MLIEGCRHELDITIPAEEIALETNRVVTDLQKKVRLPGFRPGKAPASIVRSRFSEDVRRDVLDKLIPKFLFKRIEEEDLKVVGTPGVKDLHFHDGEPLTFKAEFEVAPQIDLHDYRGVTVHYHEPEVTDADLTERLDMLRNQKAQYINIDPRPAADGDYAVVALNSLAGIDPPIQDQEMTIRIGDPEKLAAFSDATRYMMPDEVKEFDLTYPDDYGQEGLAGKTVRFRLHLKVLRTKELPDLNDEFAKDLGDFKTLDELREAVRKTIFREKEFIAQQKAKDELIDRLLETHDFPVPETYIENQVDTEAEFQLQRMSGGKGTIDLKVLKESPGWKNFAEPMRPKALKDVKASLLINRISEAESIHATNDEVDREVQRVARQEREPVAAMRKKLEKNGAIGRIAHRIQTDKTLNFLFEHARKEA